jgi:hypothetical protein
MVLPSRRADVSVGPPAEKGTMMLNTFDGYCSAFASDTPKKAKQTSTRTILSITVHLQEYLDYVARLFSVKADLKSAGDISCKRLIINTKDNKSAV